MSNLKIADWEYLYAEQILNVYLDHLSTAATAFSDVMSQVGTKAAQDGQGGIGDRCANIGTTIATISAAITDLQDVLTGKAQQFIEEIDQADQFIYGRP